jgi:hypothetical protein
VFRSCDMASEDNLDRVWSIIERVGVCMLTTRGAMGLRARPLEARPDRTSGLIWFVTDLRSDKDHEIAANHISASFSSTRMKTPIYPSPLPPKRSVIAISQRRSGRRQTICGGRDQMIRMPDSCEFHPRRLSCGMVHQVKRLRRSSFSNPRFPALVPISARIVRPP